MPKFQFNYCIFLAMLLCSTISFGLLLKQSLIVGIIIFAVVFVCFIFVFAVQQLMSTQLVTIMYMLLSTILFCIVKLVMKAYLLNIYNELYVDYNFILVPILLCGILINYSLDDKNSVPLHKQLRNVVGILILNIISLSFLGFIRELLSCGTVWGNYVTSFAKPFFASPSFSLFYIAIVFGTINTMVCAHKKTKKRYNLYVQQMEQNLKDGRYFK